MAVEPPVPCTSPKAKLSYLRRVGRRRFDLDLRPVGIELVGEDGGDARVRPLPELDVLADHRDGVVGRDAQEGVGNELAAPAAAASARPRQRQVEADDEAERQPSPAGTGADWC